MINKKMETAFNAQINAEMYSAYLYLSMAMYFESVQLKGFANWMKVQYQEEMMHATKMADFLLDRGGRVLLQAIEAPKTEWASAQAVFDDTLKHEKKVTGLIHDLLNKAIELKDHASQIFLQWYVTEQVEEEKSAEEILHSLKLIKDAPGPMFMLDHHMGSRAFKS